MQLVRSIFLSAFFIAPLLTPLAVSAALPPLPDTGSGVHLAQLFNFAVPDVTKEVGVIDYVWGASNPTPAGVYNTFYYPFDRDRNNGTVSPYSSAPGTINTAWFQKYHPDWIEYSCAAAGKSQAQANAAGNMAAEFNDPSYTPLDISNPQVLQFMMDAYWKPAIQAGFQGIDFDNVSFANNSTPSGRCGHYSSQGTWVPQFSGQVYDSAYINAILNWAQWTYQQLHAINGSVTMNFNYDYNLVKQMSTTNPLYQLLNYMDIQMPEGAFSDIGTGTGDNSVADWTTMMQYEQAAQSTYKLATVFPDYYAGATYQGGNGGNSTAHSMWTLANYLLIKSNHSYLFLGSDTVAEDLSWVTPEFTIANKMIGSPTGAMYASQGVWMRDFTTGKAIVNPDPSATRTIPIPPGYTDLYGNAVPTTITLPPQSADVIVVVPPPAPTCSMSFSPSTVGPNQNATITWSSTGATSASITPWGSVPTNGSIPGAHSGSTFTSTGTFTGAGGTTQCNATLTVTKTRTSSSPGPSADVTLDPTWAGSSGAAAGNVFPTFIIDTSSSHQLTNYTTLPSGFTTSNYLTLSFQVNPTGSHPPATLTVYVMNTDNQSGAYGAMTCPLTPVAGLQALRDATKWAGAQSTMSFANVQVLSGGWYQCAMQVKLDNAGGQKVRVAINLGDRTNSTNLPGDGQSGLSFRSFNLTASTDHRLAGSLLAQVAAAFASMGGELLREVNQFVLGMFQSIT
ncbi:MAG TPA: putative glycoside hydrolase [Candidatus Paceibacterota bacterium]|nr:putative glycoside hydrolase [Candidatus Paceibacterota bacterium]